MSEPQIFEGRAKAAAMESYLNRGGGLVSRGGDRDPSFKFQEGPMKGKTQGQAVNAFERLWATASPDLKNKYARRASIAGIGAPDEIAAAEKQQQFPAKKAYDRDADGVPDMIQRPKSQLNDEVGEPVIVGSATETAEEQQQRLAQGMTFEQLTDPDQELYSIGDGKFNGEKPGMLTERQWDSPVTKGLKSVARGVGGFLANAKPMERPTQAASTPATKPTTLPGGFSGGAQPATPTPAPVVAPTPLAKPTTLPGGFSGGAKFSQPSAAIPPTIARPEIKSVPWSGQLEKPAPVGEITGQQVIPRPARGMDPAVRGDNGGAVRLNRLTGLPFGYRPGDALPQAAGAPMQQRATASIARQASATPSAPTNPAGADEAMRSMNNIVRTPQLPIARPAAYKSPTEAGGAFSREAYARTAAAQQTGIEQQAIREGRASEATRAKHPDYVSKMEADRKMFPVRQTAPQVVPKPRLAMAR